MLRDCISSRLLKAYNPEASKQSYICNLFYQDIYRMKYIFAATANRSVRIYEVSSRHFCFAAWIILFILTFHKMFHFEKY